MALLEKVRPHAGETKTGKGKKGVAGLAALAAAGALIAGFAATRGNEGGSGAPHEPGVSAPHNPEAPDAVAPNVAGMLSYCNYLIEDEGVQAAIRTLVPGATEIECVTPPTPDEANPVATAIVSDERGYLDLTLIPASRFNPTPEEGYVPLDSRQFNGARAYGGALGSTTLPYVALVSPHGAAIALFYGSHDPATNPSTPTDVEHVYQLAEEVANNRF